MEKAINQGTVRGVLVGTTSYNGKSGPMHRLDLKLPSASPIAHPGSVSVHSDRAHTNQINHDVEITYRASTYLKRVKIKDKVEIFDETRLFEV